VGVNGVYDKLGRGNAKGSMVRPRWKPREGASALQMLLKPMLTHGKGKTGAAHPVINEWGGEGAVPSQVRAVPEPQHG
jgi:hypothetical protein